MATALKTKTALLSIEQLAIAAAVSDTSDNILVRARAGTGKTYLIRQCLPLMNGTIAIAAYNNKIAKEIRLKVAEDGRAVRTWEQVQTNRRGVDVETFHAFGFRALRSAFKGLRLEGRDKGSAGFFKFDLIADRLNIPDGLRRLVRRAIEQGQNDLLELRSNDDATAIIEAHEAKQAIVQQFLTGLVAFEKPQFAEMARSIAKQYRDRGYLTERQAYSVNMSARNAKWKVPAGLIVGYANLPVLPEAPVAKQTKDGLDPRWLALAAHHTLDLDLPTDDSVEMQLLIQRNRDKSVAQIRDELLVRGLKYAAEAIHISAQMAMETFREVRFVRGQEVAGGEFTGVISFNEMLYLPLYFNLPVPQYDWVCVDEAQDSNAARREFARRMAKPGTRFMFVGDDRQAIYGWAGADNDALDQIVTQFGCKIFPMTVTFRCSKAVVALAQRIVPDYRAANENAEGSVSALSEAEFLKIDMQPTDAIICRNTAPLVKTAYRLLARGIACHVEGRDIGRRISELLHRWPAIKNIAPYLAKLDEYAEKESAQLAKADKEAALQELTDRVETVKTIIASLPKGSKLSDAQAQVEKLFADTAEGAAPRVTLLTAHRSKGLEFPRVFGWGVNKFMPSPYAKQEWAKIQEQNLEYVLKTRAMNEYIDVEVA